MALPRWPGATVAEGRRRRMPARTLSLGALLMHRFRSAHSTSQAVSSHALSVAQVYHARFSSVQTMASASVTTRSQLDSSEHASQYAVASGSMGSSPGEELQAAANAITPTHRPRIMNAPSNMVRERNL